jgi:hypothetical protein
LDRWLKAGDVGRVKVAQTLATRIFDHVLRSDESYAEKWNYVRDNPVRAGLVKSADNWRYQGEIAVIDRP